MIVLENILTVAWSLFNFPRYDESSRHCQFFVVFFEKKILTLIF